MSSVLDPVPRWMYRDNVDIVTIYTLSTVSTVSTVYIYSIYTELADVSTSGGHHNQGRDQNYFSGNLQLFWDQ